MSNGQCMKTRLSERNFSLFSIQVPKLNPCLYNDWVTAAEHGSSQHCTKKGPAKRRPSHRARVSRRSSLCSALPRAMGAFGPARALPGPPPSMTPPWIYPPAQRGPGQPRGELPWELPAAGPALQHREPLAAGMEDAPGRWCHSPPQGEGCRYLEAKGHLET